jgi:tRNA A64-2'-O-ribosylphosphate transferase
VKEELFYMSSAPRTLADLRAGRDPFLSSQSLYSSLKELRRSTLSIPNRLRSVLKDADFIQEVALKNKLPLIANERCGNWYICPEKKAGSAYFKSTDGHSGQWSFSLRRLNLQVLEIVGEHSGAIIVDSTRRGKTMPDAFSKTVPIWCAVMNRALFPEQQSFHPFQRPVVDLPPSEIAQIEGRLDEFVRAFQDLGVDREILRKKLGKPMRLQWVLGHSTKVLPGEGSNAAPCASCQVVLLCSASRRVQGAEISEGGYIQGAGDDSEGWSQGMTPRVFWRHKDMLLHAPEDELPELIAKMLLEERQLPRTDYTTLIEPTRNLFIGAWTGNQNISEFDLLINCHAQGSDIEDGPKQLNLTCAHGKLGSRDLRCKLHTVALCAASAFEQDPVARVLCTCETGRDLSIGVALVLLCLFYSNDGKCIYERPVVDVPTLPGFPSSPGRLEQGQEVNKGFVRQRMAWISCCKPDANISRSTLQSVHAYLMDRP